MLPSNERAHKILQEVLALSAVLPATKAALAKFTWEPAIVAGGGKAARAMAQAVAETFPRAVGALAVPPEHAGKVGNIELLAAGHPLPDAGSVAAVTRQEQLLRETNGACLFLLSGGASALLGAPADGVSLALQRDLYRALLHSGLDIGAMNIVRRHVTRWGGGKFLRMAGEHRVETLLISDVLDDNLSVIGSGPTVADPSTLGEAREILQTLGQEFSGLIAASALMEETVKPGDPVLANSKARIILSNQTVTDAVAAKLGARVLPMQTGDVDACAAMWEAVLQGPAGVYVAGGEPTIRIPHGSPGRGGRNQHLVAEVARRAPTGRWLFLSIATDGMDGNSSNAGAWVDSRRAAKAKGRGIEEALENFDAAAWFEREGLAFKTGPTGTNVADIQIAIVGAHQ